MNPVVSSTGKDGLKRCFLLSLVAGAALSLSSCEEDKAAKMPDFTPVGDGMKTLAYAIIGGSVVITLGRLIRS